FAKFNAIGVDSPLNFWINQDDKDSTRYTVFLTQSGLGLPDRDYYFDDSERGREILEQYRSFITRLLTLADIEDAEQATQRIITLETRLAEHQWNKVDNRDSEKTYNPHTIAELRQLLSDYHLDSLLAGVGLDGQEQFVLRQPSYAEALNHLLPQIDMDTWRDYLRFNVLVSFAPYLSQAFEQAHFDFYRRTLSGQPEQQARWKRAISSINGYMGELLGQLYVARHFPPEAKTRMVELVDGLITAYRSSITELEWMGPETRQKALTKLAMFTPKIGYPDKWKDYSRLAIDASDLVGNIKRARTFDHQYQINKLGKPVDRSEWFMAPQRVNAYYNPGMNEIVFPAAILQPPFFNMAADDAVNYGAIGGVIGHEIGHGFDDQGSKYTGEGNLESWWTEADRAAFERRTGQLVEQYAAYEPLPGLTLNGELTLGENIGDLGGLSIALEAYRQSLDGKPAPVIDGLTGEQRVFMGWAQAWRVKRRDALTERLIKTDPHSPPKYRVNGVLPNIDAFYSAFDVKPGDKMYLPPEQRVKIW
ncbi:MAG TPA: peptidase M13, partial [Porticoccaceae bacterium]|nr:peptidase M13 [Porticoccaceae bacterium]